MATTELVERIRQKRPIAPTTVLVHFDDAYRDVCTNGAPVLKAAGVPATAFVNSGYVDTDRVFQHDSDKYPFKFENYRCDDLREWVALGFDIGAHTINHIDLGTCCIDEARDEIGACGTVFGAMTGAPVSLFSFPLADQAIFVKMPLN